MYLTVAEKHVLALRCLNHAAAVEPDSPRVHEQAIALRQALKQAKEISPKVAEIMKEEFKIVDSSADLKKVNEEFQAKHKSSPRHVLAAIRAKKILGEERSKVEKEVSSILEIASVQFEDAIEALETLREWRSTEEESFKKAAQAKFPGVTRLS